MEEGSATVQLEIIEKQMKDANVSDLFGTKKEIKSLPDIINDNETILYATSGLVSGNTILCVLTDSRIIFVDKGLVYGVKSTEIPLDMVNSVSYSKGLILAKIVIVNGATTTEIDNVAKGTADLMADKIKKSSEEYKNKLRSANQNDFNQSPNDPVDEIRKYKGLLDDGIITQDEFDAKKKQLLNL